MIIARPHRKSVAVIGAAIIAGSGLIGVAPRHVAHAAPAIPSGGTVIAAEAETPDTLNPYLTQTLSGADITWFTVFDTLMYHDPKGGFVNDLATSYSHDASGLHWTFNIVHNAKWQDGVPLTAKDIVFTTLLDKNPKFPSTSTQGFDHVKFIKAVGNYQVDVTLTSVYAPFLNYWADSPILPEHVLGKVSADKVKSLTSYNQKPLVLQRRILPIATKSRFCARS